MNTLTERTSKYIQTLEKQIHELRHLLEVEKLANERNEVDISDMRDSHETLEQENEELGAALENERKEIQVLKNRLERLT